LALESLIKGVNIMNTKDFEILQKKISDGISRRDRLSGNLEALQKQMKQDFGTDNVDELQAQLKGDEVEIQKMQAQFDSEVTELEKLVVWE
jgi:hypothetical protein